MRTIPGYVSTKNASDGYRPIRSKVEWFCPLQGCGRLNLTPEHFARILHELAEAALIRVEGQRVRILELDRLRAWAAR